MKVSKKEIREYLGHDGINCKVVIKRTGEIRRFGSTVKHDRSKDYWQFIGYVDEYKDDLAFAKELINKDRD